LKESTTEVGKLKAARKEEDKKAAKVGRCRLILSNPEP